MRKIETTVDPLAIVKQIIDFTILQMFTTTTTTTIGKINCPINFKNCFNKINKRLKKINMKIDYEMLEKKRKQINCGKYVFTPASLISGKLIVRLSKKENYNKLFCKIKENLPIGSRYMHSICVNQFQYLMDVLNLNHLTIVEMDNDVHKYIESMLNFFKDERFVLSPCDDFSNCLAKDENKYNIFDWDLLWFGVKGKERKDEQRKKEAVDDFFLRDLAEDINEHSLCGPIILHIASCCRFGKDRFKNNINRLIYLLCNHHNFKFKEVDLYLYNDKKIVNRIYKNNDFFNSSTIYTAIIVFEKPYDY